MSSSHNLIQNIKAALAQGLPGMDAHLEMTPYRKLTKTIPENRRESAVLVMLYWKNNELYFPLIQRQTYKGVHSGQVSFPGGKVEESDATTQQTALRETEEEIGIATRKIEVIGELTEVYIPPSNFLVSVYLSVHESEPEFVKEEKEVHEILEIPLSQVLDESNIKTTAVEVGNGMRLETPYFNLENKIVWGATAAILSELKAIIKGLSKV
ncbi:MAG: CoA pyrophosphatase [Flavobacteriales bacterium]